MSGNFDEDSPASPGYPNHPASSSERGWFARNRVWIIIGIIGLGVLGCSGCLLGIFGMFGHFDKMEVYQQALQTASSNPEVIAALGTPIEDSLLKSVSVEADPGKRTADYASVPLTGPDGKGVLSFTAVKTGDGPWVYSKLQVQLESGQVVDLLDGAH